MLTVNQTAPDFAVPNQKSHTIRLADYKDKNHVVLYFYPKDDTPGCTIEANEFTALANDFTQANAVILGVSKDDCASHQDFIDKYNLKIELLADTNGDLCEAYGVWQEKEKNGLKKMGIVRSTFLIDKQGMIKQAIYGVTPQGHAQAMLNAITQL